jgi:aquaporin Z
MKKYLAEGIGTFFLMLSIVLSVYNGTGNLAPIVIGCMLIGMIYAVAHISGAHFNPAVSFAQYMQERISRSDFAYYIITQLISVALASFIGVFLLSGGPALVTIEPRVNDPIHALLAEFLGTFALVLVILNLSNTRAGKGNLVGGIVVGLTVIAAAYMFGPYSGAALNPAVAVGMCVAGMVAWSDLWVYLVGILLGTAAAVSVFRVTYQEADPTEALP